MLSTCINTTEQAARNSLVLQVECLLTKPAKGEAVGSLECVRVTIAYTVYRQLDCTKTL